MVNESNIGVLSFGYIYLGDSLIKMGDYCYIIFILSRIFWKYFFNILSNKAYSVSHSINIILEDKINDGTIPFQNYTNSTLEPITRSADILISEYGALDLEDETDGSLLLNGTDGSSTDAGGRFRFELATDDNININYPNV